MRKVITGVVAVAALLTVGAAPAEAKQPPAKCKVFAVDTTAQSRYVGGRVVAMRTVTTTISRCRGKLVATTVYGAWSPVYLDYR